MKLVLVAHSYDKLCRGVIGDEVEVADDVAEKLLARGTAKLWQPPKAKAKSVNERLADLEARVALLESKGDGK